MKPHRQRRLHVRPTCRQAGAWNRLVKVTYTANVECRYYYDGRHRLIHRALTINGGINWVVEDYYYNASWQMLEKYHDLGKANPTDLAGTLKAQYVWSARYIDAQVLRDKNKDGRGESGSAKHGQTDNRDQSRPGADAVGGGGGRAAGVRRR